jgi:hypothetical protein
VSGNSLPDGWEYAGELFDGGWQRYRVNREKGVVDRAVHIEDPEETDRIAAMAEDFVRVYLRLPTQKGIVDTSGPQGPEIVNWDGRTIDVKWSKYASARLIQRIGSGGDGADVYVLVTGLPGDFVIRGWRTPIHYHRPRTRTDLRTRAGKAPPHEGTPMTAWKDVERSVARLTGGVRSWDTDIDVIVPVRWADGYIPADDANGSELLADARRTRLLEGWALECKNLKHPTIAEMELVLVYNQKKIDALHLTDVMHNGIVVKRKAGPGRETPYLFITALSVKE